MRKVFENYPFKRLFGDDVSILLNGFVSLFTNGSIEIDGEPFRNMQYIDEQSFSRVKEVRAANGELHFSLSPRGIHYEYEDNGDYFFTMRLHKFYDLVESVLHERNRYIETQKKRAARNLLLIDVVGITLVLAQHSMMTILGIAIILALCYVANTPVFTCTVCSVLWGIAFGLWFLLSPGAEFFFPVVVAVVITVSWLLHGYLYNYLSTEFMR